MHAVLEAVYALPGVRAGSALLKVGARLVAIQDDAYRVVWIGLPERSLSSLILKGDGAPLEKREKPDFESAVVARDSIFLFGSGSKKNRCEVAELPAPYSTVRIRTREDLFDAVERALDIPKRPNIEGAIVDRDRLLLFHRGAGQIASAIVCLPLDVLDHATPRVSQVRRFDLGELQGVPLHFTDAASLRPGDFLVLAAAERTDDAIEDGAVAGSALGVVVDGESERVAWTRIVEPDGRASHRKHEGLVLDDDGRGAWTLTDPDDANRPAELCRLRLGGFA